MRVVVWCVLLLSSAAYALTEDADPDFEAETELEMRNLQNQIHNNEDEIESLKLKDVALEQHDHDSIDERIRFLEAEVQKLEAGLAVFKWIAGAVGVIVSAGGVGIFTARRKT